MVFKYYVQSHYKQLLEYNNQLAVDMQITLNMICIFATAWINIYLIINKIFNAIPLKSHFICWHIH